MKYQAPLLVVVIAKEHCVQAVAVTVQADPRRVALSVRPSQTTCVPATAFAQTLSVSTTAFGMTCVWYSKARWFTAPLNPTAGKSTRSAVMVPSGARSTLLVTTDRPGAGAPNW